MLLRYEAAGFIGSLVSGTKPDYVHEFLPLFAIVRAFIHLGLWRLFKDDGIKQQGHIKEQVELFQVFR